MNLNLHKNARTTPAIRQELRESTQSERELAREYHLNRATVRQWRRRDNGQDAHIVPSACTPRSPRPRSWSSSSCVKPCSCRWMTCWR